QLTQAGAIGHCAKQMIDVVDAPANGVAHLVEGGVRVPDVAADAAPAACANECLRAPELRRDGGTADAIVGQGLPELLWRWRPHRRAGVAASSLGREIRPVEMGTQDAGASRVSLGELPASAEELQVLLVPGHGRRWQQARGAVPCVGLANGPEGRL